MTSLFSKSSTAVLWFAVGDVAGKGLPAAIVMTRAVSAARVAFHTHADDDPAAALDAIGDELFDYLSGVGLFVTMAVGSYRPRSGVVHLANAGHSPLLSVARRGDLRHPAVDATDRRGARPEGSNTADPAGAERPSGARLRRARRAGEHSAGELYGYDRLLHRVEQWAQLTVNELGDGLMNDVDEHADGAPASDDRTLVVLGESRVAR